MAENENTFSRLWDCADENAAGEKSVLLEEAVDILKARGRLASSTAIAVRQSLSFGQTFERALSHLVAGAEPSVLLAEALRFAARVSAGMEQLPVDDVLACDELLETLGLGELTADVEPAAMIDALKAERFLRTVAPELSQLRVRSHGGSARIEADAAATEAIFARRGECAAELRRLGFSYISLDLEGYRTGSLNEVL
jgi:hypothetical protein